jgi:SAM-dependent methyltransferase
MEDPRFSQFLARYPRYAAAYTALAAHDPILEQSARTVFRKQGNKLGVAAENILQWVDHAYGAPSVGASAYVSRYIERVAALNALQAQFAHAPSAATLGAPGTSVARDDYDIALLLSLVFSMHRFEILAALKSFLDFVRQPHGLFASVGMGTGYELYVAQSRLEGWQIEGYDTDPACQRGAQRLLDFYGALAGVTLGAEFPLTGFDPQRASAYDAIVLCELLEHLPDPVTALTTTRRYLRPGGAMFVTMAINIAQEDHIYLYPDVASCQAQIRNAGLDILHERALPVTLHENMADAAPASLFHGNYVAVVKARADA